jgi:hypothetical protein
MSEVHGLTAEDVARFERNDRLIKQGMCPNGCGLMTFEDGIQSCSGCSFFCNTKPEGIIQ